jgi:hypothetical protein
MDLWFNPCSFNMLMDSYFFNFYDSMKSFDSCNISKLKILNKTMTLAKMVLLWSCSE